MAAEAPDAGPADTLDDDIVEALAQELDVTPPAEAEAEAVPEVAPQPGLDAEPLPAGGRVLVYDHAGDLGRLISAAARSLSVAPEVVECVRPNALGHFLTEQRFDVLVAGPGLDTRAGFERLRIIREELPAMVVLLAVPHADYDLRDVVRAGAVDLVQAPTSALELAPALERALRLAHSASAAAPAAAPEGPSHPRRVITIGSASGGCGKTFLATNLAWFLHRHAGRRVCIVDLDLQFGEVSSALRMRPRANVTDLLAQAGDDDLADHIESCCETHASGIEVLAAPRDPEEAELVQASDVGRIIDAARAHFDDVIIDTPPALADTVVVSFNRSDELLVMATPDVPSLRNLQVFLRTLERLDVPNEGIRLFLNKTERGAGDTRRLLRVFPQGFDATMPYASEVSRSINAGRPVLDTNPGSAISVSLGDALRRLLPAEAQEQLDAQATAPSSRPWRRRRKARA